MNVEPSSRVEKPSKSRKATGRSLERVVRLRAVREIWGMQWGFMPGRLLHGTRDEDGTWTVWPPKNPEAYIIGVSCRLVRRAEPPRKRKPNNEAQQRREERPNS